jgi:hypothetical protein
MGEECGRRTRDKVTKWIKERNKEQKGINGEDTHEIIPL